MNIMYIDCNSGIAGDMFLGAMFDAGVEVRLVKEALDSLEIEGYEMEVAKGSSHGIAANTVSFNVTADQPHRHLADIISLINQGDFSDQVKSLAQDVFNLLAQAEAKVHGTSPDKIHFHEVGAIDSICDVVGALIALENLQVDKVVCSPLPLGKGHITCAHGRIPLPAPATLELVKGIPLVKSDVEGELVTPTGAALAVTLSQEFGPMPAMIVDHVGYGMGTRDYGFPNVLRVMIGHTWN